MEKTVTYFFVIFKEYSFSKIKATFMTDKHIIECATNEIESAGDTMESLAGIEQIEQENGCFVPERQLTNQEKLDLSIEKFNRNNCAFFDIFSIDNKGVLDFIESAKIHDVLEEAIEVIELFNLNVSL